MAATTSICWINGRDIATDFSLAVTGLSGWPGNLGSAPRSTNVLTGPELSGGILDPRLIIRQPGKATISGIILAATTAAALTTLDALKQLCGEGEVTVRTAYATDRVCVAILDQWDGVAFNPGALDGYVTVTLTFTVATGAAERVAPDGLALTTGRTSCPLGTAVSAPVIQIHGGGVALTNPTITVRSAAGDSVQTMGFTWTAGVNDILLVDSARSAISLVSAGVVTDGFSYWSSGDFPLIRPADGWVESAAYPTVELSSATGTAQGLITYTRRYL